jgi:hypothetical protein
VRIDRLLVWSCILSASAANAGEPAPMTSGPPQKVMTAVEKKTIAVVEKSVLAPLKKSEEKRSKFSRARMPPTERRVRVLDAEKQKDASGAVFVTFAVDERYGRGADASWSQNEIEGCVYDDTDEVFVKVGDTWRPGAHLVGKKVKPAPTHVCQSNDATHS